MSHSQDVNPLEINEDHAKDNTYLPGDLFRGYTLVSTGVSMEAILKLFGEYFFQFYKMSGYDRMLRTLGGNLMEFIENLDALHSYLALSYQVRPLESGLGCPRGSKYCGSPGPAPASPYGGAVVGEPSHLQNPWYLVLVGPGVLFGRE